MKLIEFPEQTVVIAKNQPEYLPMPAHIDSSRPEYETTICWKLSWKERLSILFSGVIWHQVWTLGKSMQPQRLATQKPEMSK